MDHTQVASSAPRALHVSTDMFGERERFDEWRETYMLKAVRVDLVTPDRTVFRAATRARMFEQLAIVASTYSPAQALRTKHLLSDGNDDTHLLVVINGALDISVGTRTVRILPGEAALMPIHEVSVINSSTQGSSLRVKLPRAVLPEIFGRAGPPLLQAIPAQNPALRLASIFAHGLLEDDGTDDPAMSQLAERQMRELMAHVFDPTLELARAAPAGGLKAARLRTVIAGIEQQLTNPALSAVWLGAKLGMSDRYVQHLLAEQGLSFSELVRRKRVERARQMLEPPGASPPRIVDVAFAVGLAISQASIAPSASVITARPRTCCIGET